jgi:hypothetical protein
MRIQELPVVKPPHANPQISPPSAGEKDKLNRCVTITAVLHCFFLSLLAGMTRIPLQGRQKSQSRITLPFGGDLQALTPAQGAVAGALCICIT